MLPKKDVPLAVIWSVRSWRLDCTAGSEESSTIEVQRLQKFCRCNCWVFVAARQNVSWPQRVSSAVRHEAAVICQVERCLPIQQLATQTYDFELYMLLAGQGWQVFAAEWKKAFFSWKNRPGKIQLPLVGKRKITIKSIFATTKQVRNIVLECICC